MSPRQHVPAALVHRRVRIGVMIGLLAGAVFSFGPGGRVRPVGLDRGPLLSDCDGRLRELVIHYVPEAAAVVETTYRQLLGALPEGCPTLEEAANALGISTWKLQRRLAEVGLTFKDVMEDTRRKLAMTYLKQPHLPLTEIAFLLGYSELSAFSRAFHRWTGVSPSTYRHRSP